MNKFLEHTNIIAVLKNKNMVLSHHSSLSYINIVERIAYDELSRFFHANQKNQSERARKRITFNNKYCSEIRAKPHYPHY